MRNTYIKFRESWRNLRWLGHSRCFVIYLTLRGKFLTNMEYENIVYNNWYAQLISNRNRRTR